MNRIAVTQETINLILKASTATLTTLLEKHGIRHSGMHRVAPLRPGMKMAGPAFTLALYSRARGLEDRADGQPD